VAQHNDNVNTGTDAEFGRGTSAFNRTLGDATLGLKNPNHGPIHNGPFIALRIVPGTLGTAAGLKTNANAQVLRDDDSAVEGLYACGNDATSMMAGIYPGAGITIGPAIVSAYLAVEDAIEARVKATA
jgi:3-oxosteroid 1-dehydrogenase